MLNTLFCPDPFCLESSKCRGIAIPSHHVHMLGWDHQGKITRQQQAWLREGWSPSVAGAGFARYLDLGVLLQLSVTDIYGAKVWRAQIVWDGTVLHQHVADSYVEAALYLYKILDLEEVLVENWRWRR